MFDNDPNTLSFLIIISFPTAAILLACWRQASKADKQHPPYTQAIRRNPPNTPLTEPYKRTTRQLQAQDRRMQGKERRVA